MRAGVRELMLQQKLAEGQRIKQVSLGGAETEGCEVGERSPMDLVKLGEAYPELCVIYCGILPLREFSYTWACEISSHFCSRSKQGISKACHLRLFFFFFLEVTLCADVPTHSKCK